MNYNVILKDDFTKMLQFEVAGLIFEILTNVENDDLTICENRKAELEEDFKIWGDYLHSDLYKEVIDINLIEKNLRNNNGN